MYDIPSPLLAGLNSLHIRFDTDLNVWYFVNMTMRGSNLQLNAYQEVTAHAVFYID